jgi:hypothetical protein
MFRVKLFIAVVAIVSCSTVASGCAAHPAQPSRPLGQPFDLKAGTSAVLVDGFKLTFDRVTEDSRCPLDAICVRAGEAIVVLTLSQSNAAEAQRELRTTPALSEASYLSYVIKLVALLPYPRSTQQIRPEDYVATLTVDRR